MRGFGPKIIEEWNSGNWSSGCVRRKPLQCERLNNSVEEGKANGFFMLKMVKVPNYAQWSYGTKDNCQKQSCKTVFVLLMHMIQALVVCHGGETLLTYNNSWLVDQIYIFVWPIWNLVSSFCFKS